MMKLHGIITRESFQVMWANIWNLYSTSFSNDRDPTVGRFFSVENSCMKTAFSCTLNAIIWGRLCESGIYKYHTSPVFKFLYCKQRGGGMGVYVAVVQPGFVNGGGGGEQSEGAKRPSWGRVERF